MKKIYIAMCIALVTLALLTAPALAKNDKCVLPDLNKTMSYNGYTANKDGSDDFAVVQKVGFIGLLYLDNKADRNTICDAWGHKRVCAIVIPTQMHNTGHKPTIVYVPAHAVMESPALKFCAPNPSIALVKTAVPTIKGENYMVNYTYVITNTGDVNLTDIILTDNDPTGKLGPITCEPIVELAPNAQMTCTAAMTEYIEIEGTPVITNTATVEANGDGSPVSASYTCTVNCTSGVCEVLCQ